MNKIYLVMGSVYDGVKDQTAILGAYTDEDREEKIGAKKIIDSMVGLLFITVPVMVLIEIFII